MRSALYLHSASIEPPSGVSPLTGNDRSRGRPGPPRGLLRRETAAA